METVRQIEYSPGPLSERRAILVPVGLNLTFGAEKLSCIPSGSAAGGVLGTITQFSDSASDSPLRRFISD
jgi:hypothetical protein